MCPIFYLSPPDLNLQRSNEMHIPLWETIAFDYQLQHHIPFSAWIYVLFFLMIGLMMHKDEELVAYSVTTIHRR